MPITKYRPEILPPRPKMSLEVKPLGFSLVGPKITVTNGGKAAKLMQEYADKYHICYGAFCNGKLLMYSLCGLPSENWA